MKRIIAISTVVSAVLFGLSVALLLASFYLPLADRDDSGEELTSPYSVPIASYARCCISDGGIWFFCGDFPYTGSTMHLGDDEGILYQGGRHAKRNRDWGWRVGRYGIVQFSFIGEDSEFVGKDRGADFLGIYYRHFEWWDWPRPWWTLCVSLWYPLFVCAILPTMWARRRIESSR